MRRNIFAAAALAACAVNGGAHGAEVNFAMAPVDNTEPAIELCGCTDACGCGSCCDSGGYALTFDVDFLFLKYRQSGGVQSSNAEQIIGNDYNAQFDFALSPRFTLGVENCEGLGARVRYWFYDDTAITDDGSGFVAVDAYTFDAEVFKRVQLGRSTTLEGFGGVRWSEFNLFDDADVDWRVEGVGLTTGFEISHHFRCNHRLYAGTRVALVAGEVALTDDGNLDDNTGVGVDNICVQMELAAGYEGKTDLGRGVTLVYGAGAELQNWSDAAIKADASDEAYLTDAGWAGFTFRLGAEY